MLCSVQVRTETPTCGGAQLTRRVADALRDLGSVRIAMERLRTAPRVVFLLATPGVELREALAALSVQCSLTCICMDDILRTSAIAHVPHTVADADDAGTALLAALTSTAPAQRTIVIEGFPRSVAQFQYWCAHFNAFQLVAALYVERGDCADHRAYLRTKPKARQQDLCPVLAVLSGAVTMHYIEEPDAYCEAQALHRVLCTVHSDAYVASVEVLLHRNQTVQAFHARLQFIRARLATSSWQAYKLLELPPRSYAAPRQDAWLAAFCIGLAIAGASAWLYSIL